jgi:hypothetical protein
LGPDRFPHEHGARRPLSAETEAEQRAADDQLREVLRKRAKQAEDREPQDRDLQRANAADAVGQIAGEPSAESREQQRRRDGETGRAPVHLPEADDRADHQRVDHEVHAVERPAGEADPEGAPLRRRHVGVEGGEARILDRNPVGRRGRHGVSPCFACLRLRD